MSEFGTSALQAGCLCLSIGLLSGCKATASWDFETEELGDVPAEWTIGETNPSEELASWRVLTLRVLADNAPSTTGRVLACAETKNRGQTFNLALAGHETFGDLELEVAVQARSGVEDQGGGPLWRCIDQNNYYVCRFNPLESNYRVYVVKDGKREQLQSATVETRAEQWYAVRVTMKGNRIACYLNGEKLLEVEDDTFSDPGRIGLWTKADAVTWFDNLTVNE